MNLIEQITKYFRGQRVVYDNEPGFLMPQDIAAVEAWNKIAIATRAVNIIVDYAYPVELNVYKKERQSYIKAEASKVDLYLDFPNPKQSKADFWSQHYLWLLLYGTAFIVLENDGLYNLYPPNVEIESDPRSFIKNIHYGFGKSRVSYDPSDVAIVRLSSKDSYYLGNGVFDKVAKEVNLINKMLTYHDSVLKTGGIHKFVFRTENILSQKIKDKIREEWQKYHSISSKTPGQPPILEGGLALDKINITMDDLDFNQSVERLDKEIAIALGVPPALMTGDKSSDIDKLLKLFYLSTVNPIIDRSCSALTLLIDRNRAWFRIGKQTLYIRPDLNTVLALREDTGMRAKAAQSLYVSGIITRNEARAANGYPEDGDEESNEFMTPANIAGSNLNPASGGRPKKNDQDDNPPKKNEEDE